MPSDASLVRDAGPTPAEPVERRASTPADRTKAGTGGLRPAPPSATCGDCGRNGDSRATSAAQDAGSGLPGV